MLKQSEPPLLLELKPSRRLQRTIALLHLLASGAAIANSLAITIKFTLCALLCLSYGLLIKRLAVQCYHVRYSEQSGWEASGLLGLEPVRIIKSTIITSFVIVLYIKSNNNDKSAILVVSDALCEDDYRKLILKLKTTAI